MCLRGIHKHGTNKKPRRNEDNMDKMNTKTNKDTYHNPRGFFTLLDVSKYPVKYLDIPYDTLSDDQKLDIYLPENRGKELLPAVVYVHGGGFEMGDRKYGHIERILDGLKKGFAVISVSYRLSQEAIFPAAVIDVRNAVRYIRKHGNKYGIDRERIGLLGESAGGNLVALAAMNPKEEVFDAHIPEELRDTSARIAACVDWFGVIDMSCMRQQNEENHLCPPGRTMDLKIEARYMGQDIPEVPADWLAKTNPITYLSENVCPMLIEHGTGDFNVPYQQSVMLYEAIVEKCGKERAELFLLYGAVHEDPAFEQEDNMALVWHFLKRQLQKD